MHETEAPPSSDRVTTDRLLAVQMEEWPVAGGPVRIELAPEKTVLVGKNGAGKSIALEAMFSGAIAAVHSSKVSPLGSGSVCFEADILGERLSYSYRWGISAANESDDDDGYAISWEESCRRISSKEEIWQVKDGIATFEGGMKMALSPDTGVLTLGSHLPIAVPPQVPRLRKLLRGLRFVRAGIPRTQMFRLEIQLSKRSQSEAELRRSRRQDNPDIRLEDEAIIIANWHDDKPRVFEHFQAVCRRLGIATDIQLRILREEPGPTPSSELVKIGQLLFDGTDFVLLSDGTLRAIEIVLSLVAPKVTILIIEEPETAIHPGFLRRLLAEIEAHAIDRQVIVSTHSPLVVDWAKATDVRLVERNDGRTMVRGLSSSEIEDVTACLNDDLNMSDYIYSRSAE